MNHVLPIQTDALDRMLDAAHPPVARLRIMSTGLATNHTLDTDDHLDGTAACIACGNCVNACPVVAGLPDGALFVRTSMHLEHVVASDCRRCFRCIAACPQVSLPLKEYVRSFRRGERIAHWLLLASYAVLVTTGVLVHHWGTRLPLDLRWILGLIHRAGACGLVAAPIAFAILDRHHLACAVRRSVTWSAADAAWARDAWRWIASVFRVGRLHRGAFNPGQRLWYLYVPLALAAFAATGVVKWAGAGVVGEPAVALATFVHVAVAYVTDGLVALHVWLKVGWPAMRDAVRGLRQLQTMRQWQQRPFELEAASPRYASPVDFRGARRS